MHEADKESGIKTSKSTGKSNQSSLYTTHSKSTGGNHRFVIFRPVSHDSSVVFRNDKSVAHHSDDSVGLFRQTHQSPSHNVALISGHQSINLDHYVCMNAKKFISDFYMHKVCKQRIQFSNSGSSHNSQNSHKPESRLRYSQVMLEAVKSRSVVPSTIEFYLNRFLNSRQKLTACETDFSWLRNSRQKASRS
ncbi:hypothetical protein F511_07991 [Dorcoceras hygrometricum]|uniref:Uncharacterized protein n=1 Tax=Dorcoceras hygrometricum TaxID=472368 RepID=A0A2Z7BHL4_9LAMI|nr:hypothetical protein F511_07991 [Dorcoceras hygrometricum]